ncbi:hypothetical protein ACLB2K_019095 [Fragaria x ananassa]
MATPPDQAYKDVIPLDFTSVETFPDSYMWPESDDLYSANETDAHELWKKLESLFEKKTAAKKAFLIKELVNMKYSDGVRVTEHLNNFQSTINQLTTMGMAIDDELQALLLLGSLPDNWETFVITVSNSAPDGKMTMENVKSNLLNEETRRKASSSDNSQVFVAENRGRSKSRGPKGHGKSRVLHGPLCTLAKSTRDRWYQSHLGLKAHNMLGGMTKQQKFDWYDQMLGELAGVPDRLIDITSILDRVDLDELATRVNELGELRGRVTTLHCVDLDGLAARVDDLERLKGLVTALEKMKAPRLEVETERDGGYVSQEQVGAMGDALETLQVTMNTMTEDVRATIDAFKKELLEMNTKLNLAIRAMSNQLVMDYRRVKVPEPQAYGGA